MVHTFIVIIDIQILKGKLPLRVGWEKKYKKGQVDLIILMKASYFY